MVVPRDLYESQLGGQVQCRFLGLRLESDLDLEEVLDLLVYFKQVPPLILMCGHIWEPRSSPFGLNFQKRQGVRSEP